MARLHRDGVELYYETHGQGPAVLLSHGFSATSQMWRPQLDALARDHRLIVWDMRGHGRSDAPDAPDAYSVDATLDDMAALLDTCGADRAIVGGHSLGGYMSLAFAERYPERTAGLALLNTGPGFKRDEPRAAWNQQAKGQAERFESLGLDALPPEHTAWAGTHDSAAGLARAARGMLVQADGGVYAALGRHEMPALVLVGSEDRAFLRAAELMAARLPRARHVEIPAAGHAANIDQPELVNAALREFLKDVFAD
jgi:pimeloyl-ACP methyl ester carboxylesterase